jgi:sec-independent protein translocase protein TatB
MGIPPPIETANISMGDTLLLMVLALVVLGPRRLPQLGRQIGKLMYEFRKASNDFKFQMEEELRQAEEADRRKKEEEERKRALAAAPAPPQIAPPAQTDPQAESPVAPAEPQVTPAAPEPPAEIAADVPDANVAPAAESTESERSATVAAAETPVNEPEPPRILPPAIGETVAAERPGAQARQRELFAADDGNATANTGRDAERPEAERSEPAEEHHAHHNG